MDDSSLILALVVTFVVAIPCIVFLACRGHFDILWKDDEEVKGIREGIWQRYVGSSAEGKPVTLPPEVAKDIKEKIPDHEVAIKTAIETSFAEGKAAGVKSSQEVQNKDRAIIYNERIIDRIINKARGILPFNSILIALLAGTNSYFNLAGQVYKFMVAGAIICLLFSSLAALKLFAVQWGHAAEYGDFRKEFDRTIEIARARSWWLQFSIGFSVLALLGLFSIAGVGFWNQLSGSERVSKQSEEHQSQTTTLSVHEKDDKQRVEDLNGKLSEAAQHLSQIEQQMNSAKGEVEQLNGTARDILVEIQKWNEQVKQNVSPPSKPKR
jgi:hypothetical protein